MKLIQTIISLSLFALPLGALGADKDDEKPVKFDELPAGVAKAIKEAAGDAKITNLVREKDDDVEAFEATWEVKGKRHEVVVGLDGKVLCKEEVIDLADAPEPVRAAIAKAANGKKVKQVEKGVEKGKTFYEAQIESAKGTLEVKLDATGKELEREEGDEKD